MFILHQPCESSEKPQMASHCGLGEADLKVKSKNRLSRQNSDNLCTSFRQLQSVRLIAPQVKNLMLKEAVFPIDGYSLHEDRNRNTGKNCF